GGRPSVRQLNVKFIVSEPTRLLAMRSGGIDGAFRVPLAQVDQWQRLHNVQIQFAPELRTAYLSLDLGTAPWNDVHVRRAVAYPNSEQYLGEAAQALSASLKKIGIKLTVKEIPSSQWFNIIYSHPNPIGPQIISWGVDYPDPADAAHFIYDSHYATANAFNTS